MLIEALSVEAPFLVGELDRCLVLDELKFDYEEFFLSL